MQPHFKYDSISGQSKKMENNKSQSIKEGKCGCINNR